MGKALEWVFQLWAAVEIKLVYWGSISFQNINPGTFFFNFHSRLFQWPTGSSPKSLKLKQKEPTLASSLFLV